MAWRIEEYRTAAGETPVRTFIAALPPDAKAEAVARRAGADAGLPEGCARTVEEGEDREEEVMMMARKSDLMKWVDHQVETDADLKRKVEEYLNEMMVEQKLAALRSQRGMTQAQLAERLGVSQPHIAKLEAGRAKNIELHTLCRWATALGAKLTVDVVPNAAVRKRKRTAA